MTPFVLLLAGGIGMDPLPIPSVPEANAKAPPVYVQTAPLVIETPISKAVEPEIELSQYVPQPGDVIVFLTHGPLRRVGTWAYFGGATHAAIVVPNDGGVALLETPQVGTKVKLNDIHHEMQKYWGTLWIRRRTTPLTPEQCERLESFAKSQLGKPYDIFGWLKLAVSFPLTPFCDRPPSDEDLLKRSTWMCSALVGGACCYARLIDSAGLRPRCLVPADFKRDRIVDLSCGWSAPTRVICK